KSLLCAGPTPTRLGHLFNWASTFGRVLKSLLCAGPTPTRLWHLFNWAPTFGRVLKSLLCAGPIPTRLWHLFNWAPTLQLGADSRPGSQSPAARGRTPSLVKRPHDEGATLHATSCEPGDPAVTMGSQGSRCMPSSRPAIDPRPEQP